MTGCPRAVTGVALAAAVMAMAAAAGCGVAQRADSLEEAVRTYNEGVRWHRFENASVRVPVADRDDFLDDRDQLSEILRIESYEVVRVRLDRTQTRARVHVKYSWYSENEGIVRTTHAVQSWEKRDDLWLMVGEERLRGDEMPGVPEPEPEPGEDDAPADGQDPGEDASDRDDRDDRDP